MQLIYGHGQIDPLPPITHSSNQKYPFLLMKSAFGSVQRRDEDPDPVGSVDFWPAGSGLFSTDPDPTCNN